MNFNTTICPHTIINFVTPTTTLNNYSFEPSISVSNIVIDEDKYKYKGGHQCGGSKSKTLKYTNLNKFRNNQRIKG
jgi:hypothetical protein